MIQRIQSLWLLLAALLVLGLFLLPSFTGRVEGVEAAVYATGIKLKTGGQQNLLLLMSTLMAAVISLINIFNYRNRSLQKRIAILNMLLLVLLLFWYFQLGKTLEASKIGIGIFLPMAAILFSFLAIKGIQFDEKLIRSADRLR